MRVIVCGGRDFNDKAMLWNVLDGFCKSNGLCYPEDEHGNWLPKDFILIHGGARGADLLADDWGVHNFVCIEEHKAAWYKFGKAAGAIRNRAMLDQGKPDAVIAFPGGRGTADMVQQALCAGVKVFEVTTDGILTERRAHNAQESLDL